MLDQIRRDIQARLEDLLDEIDTLRRALAALTSRESEPDRAARATPPGDSASAGESAAKSSRAATPRASRPRKASVLPRPAAPPGSEGAGAPARTAPGATKAAVLVALKDAGAMTAGEIAAATGLSRATVSTTLSKLATSGAITKAARGYQLERESDTIRKPAPPRPRVSTVATSPSRQATEPRVVESSVPEPPAAEPPAAEPPAAALLATELQADDPTPGATERAVLAALADGSAMTAGQVATATGLGRANVSTTVSQLAKAGELTKAARGYQIARAEPAQRFYFPPGEDATRGTAVANLTELEAEIAVCDPEVMRHHCASHDFSLWIAGVLHNEPLASDIAVAEANLFADSSAETVEDVRLALITALHARHATHP